MSLYRLLRPLLFRLDPETSHHLTFRFLRAAYALPGTALLVRACTGHRVPRLPAQVMGLTLTNPVGLAAGLDKNAECLEPFTDLGFGFIELGTVTPKPQPGNPRPRLFRLEAARALINRMGFNNAGVEEFVAHLQAWDHRCPIGINIGKNKDTPNERALDDYVTALRTVYRFADYITVNISSPNTPGLRALQGGEQLDALLTGLQAQRAALAAMHGRQVPIALKIAPDLDHAQIAEIAELVLRHRFDAIVATNTTLSRVGVEGETHATEAGGLSGRPLKARATEVIATLYRTLQGRIPIIGVGGIENADDAWDKLVAGADAVQVYSAFIYEGPQIVRRIVEGLAHKVEVSGCATLAEAIAQARA